MYREIFLILLCLGLVICAIATAFSKKLMMMVIIFTAYSLLMSVIWLLLEAPDLAITEAAVGAGVTGVLFFLMLRRIHQFDRDHLQKDKNSRDGKDAGKDA